MTRLLNTCWHHRSERPVWTPAAPRPAVRAWDSFLERHALPLVLRLFAVCAAVGADAGDVLAQATTATNGESAEAARVLGFENPSDWTLVEGGDHATLSQSGKKTQGKASLAVSGGGRVVLRSVALSSPLDIGALISFDLFLSHAPPAPNVEGTVEVVFDAPSVGIHQESLGTHTLTGHALNVWHTLTYHVPHAVLVQLTHMSRADDGSVPGFDDLRISLVIEVPLGLKSLVDNLVLRVPREHPPLIATPIDPSAVEPIPGFDPGTLDCGPGLDLGPLVDAGGQPAYASITYPKGPVDPRPGPNCREAIQFCDDDENPIPAPTEAELSGPPQQTVPCPPLSGPSLDTCTIDPATVSGACTVDADCAQGEVCGVLCTSPDCSTADRQCGRLFASCAGMPDVGDTCDPRVFRVCADRNNVVTVTEAEAEQQVPREDEPQPGVQIPEDEQLEVPPYEPISRFLNVACLDNVGPQKELKQESAPGLHLGGDNWGLFVEPFFENRTRLSFVKGIILANEQIEIGGGAGLRAGGNVLGKKITAVDGAVNVALGECQSAIGLELKIFGEAVAALDTVDGARSQFDTLIPSGRGRETPPAAKDDCIAKFKNRNQEASFLRKSMFIARNVQDFSLSNGVSEDLCKRTNKELGTNFECEIDNIDIPNAWKFEYDKAVEKYKKTKTDFDLSRGKVAVDAQINLFDLRHRYRKDFPEVHIPVGPVTIQIALGAFGSWHFSGFLQMGLRYDSEFKNLAAELVLPFATLFTPPASVRAIAGAVLDPGVEMGVVAFAGVGIPGVAIGLEGSVTVLGLSLPIDTRAAAVRRLEPDTRDLANTDYAGPLIEGLEPQVYHWFFGGSYGARLVLNALKGDLDAVARVRVFFVRKTFRKRLARLNGFTKTLVAVGDEFGKALTEREDFGPFADEIAFTGVIPLTDGDIIVDPDPSAIYPGTLDRSQACIEGDLVPVPVCHHPSSFFLGVTIRNQGDTDAPASTTKVEFGSAPPILLMTPPIAAGGAIDLPPISLPFFTSDFTITADFGNELRESNEANNSATGRCIIIE